MTDTLKKNFEKFRKGKFKEVLDSLEQTFEDFEIDFYLIGAMSRDLWIEGTENVPNYRATLDLDFAVYTNSYDTYERLTKSLIDRKFRRTQIPYRLKYGDIIIDLLPFGQIEKDGDIIFKSDPPLTLSVRSFDEAIKHSFRLSKNFQIVTLPGLCIMKLVSFSENPDKRLKDFEDFTYILDNYFNIFRDKIFEDYSHLIAEYNNDQIAGAIVLGKEMSNVLGSGDSLRKIIIKVLTEKLSSHSENEINDMYESDRDDKVFKRWKLILELKREISK